jgi:hypothetical protein
MKNEMYSKDRNKILVYEKGFIDPFISYTITVEERVKLKQPFKPVFEIIYQGFNMSYEDLLDIAENEGFDLEKIKNLLY